MNSRERTFLALRHKLGDRIPIDFWATGAVARQLEEKYKKSYSEVLDDFGVDLRYIDGPSYIGPPLPPGTDIWGVERTIVVAGISGQSESYSETTVAPLESATTVDEIEAYRHWPDADMFDYSAIETQCDSVLKQNRVVVFMGDRLNRVAQLKPAMYLRGTEKIFLDLALHPDIVYAIFRRIKKFYLAYLERILKAAMGKIDIVMTGDDFGAQNGLLISTDMWRKFIKPGFSQYLELIKRFDTISMHHSCGSVVDIIPEMIECGLDVLQSIQPDAANMSLADLKARFGAELCFHGGISIQRTIPFGTPGEIRQEVRRIAGLVGAGGGYIFCTAHNIQADTPIENVIALFEAYKEFG